MKLSLQDVAENLEMVGFSSLSFISFCLSLFLYSMVCLQK